MGEGRFFDGETLDPDDPPVILLERVLVDGREMFKMRHRLAYHDHQHAEPHVVPADTDHFVSDLTSVPSVFAWLVPRTGRHLPAALVHDGLVDAEDEPISYLGPAVDREEADRIFRDSMGELGTSLVRRWLMWTAVIIASVHLGAIRPSTYLRAVMYSSLVLIVALGTLATLDLFDATVFGWRVELPWMGDRPWTAELLGGALMAVVIPAVMSVAWLRLWRAGLIAGIALALLLHVTVVIALLTAAFRATEWIVGRLRP